MAEAKRKEIKEIIDELKAAGLYSEAPLMTDAELAAVETEFQLSLPEDYKYVAQAGGYDIANFYFEKPRQAFPGYLTFARWNDDYFGLDLDAAREGRSHVYVLINGSRPEKRFDDFYEWFKHVVQMARRPVNPE